MQEADTGSRAIAWLQLTLGRAKLGRPVCSGPSTATPSAVRLRKWLTRMVPTTNTRGKGARGANRLPSRMPATTTTDRARVTRLRPCAPATICQA